MYLWSPGYSHQQLGVTFSIFGRMKSIY